MRPWRQRNIVMSAALGGSAAAAHSATAAGDGRGKGKGDRRCDGDDDATATECAMVTQQRWKAGRLGDQGGGHHHHLGNAYFRKHAKYRIIH